ncbi:ubiquinol-cytochrome-c reductase complex assembly factor 3-like [Ptychodera flava]|uniref:ubiquinol-cytochrome-c reductase complex assembly factor 3-like n=1 Tax=Ptychodera flava TaxID=63121 RepID=UPI003969E248
MAARRIAPLAIIGGLVAGGCMLMYAISPNEEELIKKLPEHNAGRMDESKSRQQLLLNKLKEAADSPDPVWLTKRK